MISSKAIIHPTAKIHPTAVIYDGVYIGENVEIGAYCIIGAPAESKKYWGLNSEYSVIISKGSILTGHVTVDAGTITDTFVGVECFLMKHSHVGHDASISRGCVIAPGASVGGHARIGRDTNLGMGSRIHQRVEVGKYCMIGMNTVVTKTTEKIDNAKFVGAPAKYIGSNER